MSARATPLPAPIRIAYVIGELGKGGAEYQLHQLLLALDRPRFLPRVFVLAAGGHWTGPIRDLGIDVEELPRHGGADVRRLLRLRAAVKAFAPHVLHTIRWSGNTYGWLASVGLGIPLVIAAERVRYETRPWQRVVTDRLLDPLTDAYLVNSSSIADGLVARERVARGKIHVVHNGIDLGTMPPFVPDRTAARVAAGFAPERRLVAQVGRLIEQKDFPTFLRAAVRIAAEVPDVDFLVVGDGALRPSLEADARALGLGERVRFTGLRHDVPALLGGVDVLTLTSTFEGLPNAVLEAMATGAVAVATDVGGVRELVVPGETVFVVPARAPEAVADAVVRVLCDPALARRLAVAARRRLETEFSVEQLARRTEAAYVELLRARLPHERVVAAA